MTTANHTLDPEGADARLARLGVASIWLVTALTVVFPSYRTIGEAYLARLGLSPAWMFAACAGELALGVWVLLRPYGPALAAAQAAMVGFFTVVLAALDPSLLVHPIGVLSKNAPIFACIFAARWLRDEARRRAALRLLTAAVSYVWIHEGLLPKLLFQSELELGWVRDLGVLPFAASTAVALVGAIEIAVGLAIVLPIVPTEVRRWILYAQLGALALLPVVVIVSAPEFLVHPFGPLSKNLPLAAATLVVARNLPARKRSFRQDGQARA